MRIAENIEMLEIAAEGMVFHPVLIWDDKEVVLLDCTLPGKLELLEQAMAHTGFAPKDVTTLIITHQDMDHVGCAAEIRNFGAKLLAHEVEAPYIQGDATPVRLADAEAEIRKSGNPGLEQLEYLEQNKKAVAASFVPVDNLLRDGELLELVGGIRVIHTPGHMPGHISLHILRHNIIVAGDATISENGVLKGPNPQFTKPENMPEANESLQKLLALNPQKILCFHGGEAIPG